MQSLRLVPRHLPLPKGGLVGWQRVAHDSFTIREASIRFFEQALRMTIRGFCEYKKAPCVRELHNDNLSQMYKVKEPAGARA